MSSDVVTIALATGSAIKKDATQIAFQKLFPSSEVQLECFVTTSDINEQPIGFEETMRGALNRLNNMKTLIPEGGTITYKVAIENGLVQATEELWIDVGWVMVESVKTGNRYVASSTGLPFETKYVKKAEEIGFDKMTVGEVMSKELGCDAKDPHKYLCGEVLGRKEMLVQTIETCVGQCLKKEGSNGH